MEQKHIDELLERYLGLLDEYTRLRKELSQAQSSIYQNIARANFAGERGMRYGQNNYDERMQATRLLAISADEKESPTFAIVRAPEEEEEVKSQDVKETDLGEEGSQPAVGKDSTEQTGQKDRKNRNPLHWFGFFAPMPLRTAQTQSVQAIEKIIPRLVSVNAEMLSVEIKVRRARKRRAKTETPVKNETASATSNEGLQSQAAPLEAA